MYNINETFKTSEDEGKDLWTFTIIENRGPVVQNDLLATSVLIAGIYNCTRNMLT